MVDAVLSSVLKRVGDYLIQEAVFLRGVRKEVEFLKNELEWMQCFIKDAEEKQSDDAMIRKWVSDIIDIAYDTEDVLDTFMLKVHDGGTSVVPEVLDERTPNRMLGFFTSINCFCTFDQESSHKASSLCSKGKDKVKLHGIGKEIEALRKRISDLSQKRAMYCLEDPGNQREERSNALGKLKELRRVTSFVAEENVVGFEDDVNNILAKILGNEPRRLVISIFGMGGLGKTTLAKKLYHSNDARNNFDCCAWVYVSQDYKTRDLLLRIMESLQIRIEVNEREHMSNENLERHLYNSLQGRSYLMVIDDVWQKEAWESLKKAFPDNKNGSRIIITTRIKEVAQRTDERTHIHQLRFLSPDESWKLFCQKAFPNPNTADEGLKKLGREMVEKCGGLPLAIVVLGGLLSTKMPHEWRAVRDHIWRHLRNDSIHISCLLALSFDHLPYQLKLCFLYLGLFPEDHEIGIEKLIRLLVAEGFIQLEDEGQILEEVAEESLYKLIDRSLVQIEKQCWGRVQTCRVHDLLRDLAIEKAKELNFLHICDEVKNSSSASIISPCRRQAIYSRSRSCLWLQHCNPLSRSLLFFDRQCDESFKLAQHLTPLCTRFKLLRVLNVEDLVSENRSLPQEIGKLVHLRYLGLRNAYIYEFPSSIVNLQRLQTLDLFGIEWMFPLPTEISKLRELRHLIGNFIRSLPIDNLTNLQTLRYVSLECWTKFNPERLVNLRELRIKFGWAEEKEFSLDSVAKLTSLRILSIRLRSDQSFGPLQPLGHCPSLVDLRLIGKIEKLPRDLDEVLPNLECLKLSDSLLKDDPMLSLQKLPNLMVLVLGSNSYSGKKLICTARGFPRLEILQLDLECELEEWQITEDAMPMLKSLRIAKNSKLRIPERLKSIPCPGKWECERKDEW